MGVFVVALVFHVSKKTCFGKFRKEIISYVQVERKREGFPLIFLLLQLWSCKCRSGSARNILVDTCFASGCFLFFRNGDGKTFCVCATHSDFLLWPHSKAFFDMRLGLGKSVISRVNLRFSQPHTAVEKFLHESSLFNSYGGRKGESPSCLIRRLKLLKVEVDP